MIRGAPCVAIVFCFCRAALVKVHHAYPWFSSGLSRGFRSFSTADLWETVSCLDYRVICALILWFLDLVRLACPRTVTWGRAGFLHRLSRYSQYHLLPELHQLLSTRPEVWQFPRSFLLTFCCYLLISWSRVAIHQCAGGNFLLFRSSDTVSLQT